MPRNGAWRHSRRGEPAPPAVLELSEIHEQPTFVLAPGHDLGMVEEFARLLNPAHPRGREASGRATEHDRLPAIVADPFWVPDLDRFISEHEPWVAPEALDAATADPGGTRARRRAGGAVRRNRRRSRGPRHSAAS